MNSHSFLKCLEMKNFLFVWVFEVFTKNSDYSWENKKNFDSIGKKKSHEKGLISDYDAPLSAKNLITTEEGLITDRNESNSRNIFGQTLAQSTFFKLKEDGEEEEKKEQPPLASPEKRFFIDIDRGSKRTSFMSASSQMKLSKIYESAVKTKYYPTFFRTFLYFLYTTFMIIFILQLVFSSQTTTNISSLKTMKDASNKVQESNIVISMLQSSTGYVIILSLHHCEPLQKKMFEKNFFEKNSKIEKKFFVGNLSPKKLS